MTKGRKGMHNTTTTNMGTPSLKQGNMKESRPQGGTQTICSPRDDTWKVAACKAMAQNTKTSSSLKLQTLIHLHRYYTSLKFYMRSSKYTFLYFTQPACIYK
jgi:hypothetical protein